MQPGPGPGNRGLTRKIASTTAARREAARRQAGQRRQPTDRISSHLPEVEAALDMWVLAKLDGDLAAAKRIAAALKARGVDAWRMRPERGRPVIVEERGYFDTEVAPSSGAAAQSVLAEQPQPRPPSAARVPAPPAADEAAADEEDGGACALGDVEGVAGDGGAEEAAEERPTEEEFVEGTKLACEYYARQNADHSCDASPAKRQRLETPCPARVEPLPPEPERFAADLLACAPASLQSCRSLAEGLRRKLAAPPPPAPSIGGPPEIATALASHAERAGRLLALRSPTGWDARARRVLEVTAWAATPGGQAALEAAERAAAEEAVALQTKLAAAAAGDLEALTRDRREWAKAGAVREWWAWCVALLRRRERDLLAAMARLGSRVQLLAPPAASSERGAADNALTMADIAVALLAGGRGPPGPEVQTRPQALSSSSSSQRVPASRSRAAWPTSAP